MTRTELKMLSEAQTIFTDNDFTNDFVKKAWHKVWKIIIMVQVLTIIWRHLANVRTRLNNGGRTAIIV